MVELVRRRRTVGQYRLEREIARGGMGVVYAAYDERLNRWVALKLLLGEFADDRDFRARFIHESRSALALDHPHILPVFDTGEADGILYIATRLVDGLDLRHHLAQALTLSVERALTIAAQVAAALDYSHNRGLVHRDVKPANVLLVAEEQDHPDHAYLIDFGITTSQSRDMRLTATGHFVGTPEYISPEQINQTLVDGRADQYALACVLYECLAGASPFRRATTVDVLHAHLHEEPAPPSSLVALPRSVDRAILRALSKDPAQRFHSCRAFIAAARGSDGAAAGGSDVETASGLVPDLAVARPARRRSRAALIAALGVLAATAGALVATQLGRRNGRSPPPTTATTATGRTTATTTTIPGPQLHPIDVRALRMRQFDMRGYRVDLPRDWQMTERDELQSARPRGVSRRRTTTSDRAREVTILIDALANYKVTPEENGKSLHVRYSSDPGKPGYRRTSAALYNLGGTLAYQWAYRYRSRGRTVYNAEVILRHEPRHFAVLAYGQAKTADLAELARTVAESIALTTTTTPPPPPPRPPPPPPPPPPARGTARPTSGTYTGIAHEYDDNREVIDSDTVRIKFTKRHGETIIYPNLGCRGRLYQVTEDGSQRVFREDIEAGTCLSGRRWRIERLSSHSIHVTRTSPRGEPRPMTGTLKRE